MPTGTPQRHLHLEPFLCKRSPRTRLQVAFKGQCLLLKTLLNIVSNPCIKTIRKTDALEHVDEFHVYRLGPPTSLRDFGVAAFAMVRPSRGWLAEP